MHKKAGLMEMRLIHWLDAAGGAGAWRDIDDVRDERPHECQSIGFVVNETEEFVTIVQTVDDNPANHNVCHFMCIPKSYIRKSKVLK